MRQGKSIPESTQRGLRIRIAPVKERLAKDQSIAACRNSGSVAFQLVPVRSEDV
jgi:hypothetical protein